MAANFGYDEDYVDNRLDMDSLFAHMQYLHDNPPIGGLFKKYLEIRYGVKDEEKPVQQKHFKNEAERKNAEKTELHKMIADFGGTLEKKPKRRLRTIF